MAEPEARLQPDKPVAQVSVVRAARSLYQIVHRLLPKRFTATLDSKGHMEARQVVPSCAGGQHSTCAAIRDATANAIVDRRRVLPSRLGRGDPGTIDLV